MPEAGVEVHGEVHPDFAVLADLLGREVGAAGRGGGAVAVVHRGELVADLWAGERDEAGTPWAADTVVMCQSTTKGVTSTALHLCVERGLVAYDDPVAQHWPEFAAAGKDQITVAHLLTHEAGLFPVRPLVDDAAQMNDWDHMVTALAAATPVHPPGEANGYHAFTFGWLVGEVVRRATGRSVGRFVQDELAGPLGCDGLFIGLPEGEVPRLATFVPAEAPPDGAAPPVGLGDLAASGPAATTTTATWSLDNVREALAPVGIDGWLRSPDTPRAEVPAAGGCFTARSLARLYGMWAEGGALDGTRLVAPERVDAVARQRTDRSDLVLFLPVGWRLGFHPPFVTGGTLDAGFGHNGFGGSGAWADPSRRLAVAFTTSALSGASAIGDSRVARIGTAAVDAADGRRP